MGACATFFVKEDYVVALLLFLFVMLCCKTPSALLRRNWKTPAF